MKTRLREKERTKCKVIDREIDREERKNERLWRLSYRRRKRDYNTTLSHIHRQTWQIQNYV